MALQKWPRAAVFTVAGMGILIVMLLWTMVDDGFLKSDMERDVDYYRQASENRGRLILELQAKPLRAIFAEAADSSMVKSDTSFIYGTVGVTTNRDTTRIVRVE